MPKFLTNLDMMKNEIKNLKFETLASHPTNPVEGQIYFNTTDDIVYIYINGSWKDISSADVTQTMLSQNTGASLLGVDNTFGISGSNLQEILENLKTYIDSAVDDKFTQIVGDGTSTSFVVTHNFGTQDVLVMVRQNSAPYAIVNADVEITDSNNVTVKFASAPSVDEYKVIIMR